jgi:sterol desaturase/sphingolipid hydroxylase (fatty acid hydroxylase superfamily)
MIPSNRSIRVFFTLNGILLLYGFIQSCWFWYIFNNTYYIYYAMMWCLFLQKNYVLLYGIQRAIQDKPRIEPNNQITEKYLGEFQSSVVMSAFLESITYECIRLMFYKEQETMTTILMLSDFIYFIPWSFSFELVFDLFHYSTHRMMHHPSIYMYFHKKHHTYPHPIPILAFYQDPMDIIITNSIPMICTMYIFNTLHICPSFIMLHWMLVYKTYIEICGHSGCNSYPTSSFPQCIWLPKWFQFEIYTEIHDLHHCLNTCNYSKRFSLWDKVFGTYREKNE